MPDSLEPGFSLPCSKVCGKIELSASISDNSIKEDLINIIEDFWIHSGETGEILKNGWDLDSIVSNNVLLDKIIELNNEDNE